MLIVGVRVGRWKAHRRHGVYGGFIANWPIAPLVPAIHLGARRVLAVAVRYRAPGSDPVENVGYPPPAQVLGMLMNAIFLDAMESDAERLERVNRSLAAAATDRSSSLCTDCSTTTQLRERIAMA